MKGSGSGNGYGDGRGNGYGDGRGSGSGNGYGNGYGYGYGRGNGYGRAPRCLIYDAPADPVPPLMVVADALNPRENSL